MKNTGEKIGNDVWCDLTPEAIRIIGSIPKAAAEIFPCEAKRVSSSFTKACALLDIEDLHFHDFRHDGILRLFELGWKCSSHIKQCRNTAAAVSSCAKGRGSCWWRKMERSGTEQIPRAPDASALRSPQTRPDQCAAGHQAGSGCFCAGIQRRSSSMTSGT